MTKYKNIKDKLGIGCNKPIAQKEESNYGNNCSTGYQLCDECFGKSVMLDRYIELIEHKTKLEYVELLNHNKRKIFLGEDRDVNEMFLNIEFLRTLAKRTDD